MCTRIAITSTSPDASSGFGRCRRNTRPSTATTYSGRTSSAFACASEYWSRLHTTWQIPARSRRSRKISCPKSRRRCTQPINTTLRPASATRSSPQYPVRFSSPNESNNSHLLFVLCRGGFTPPARSLCSSSTKIIHYRVFRYSLLHSICQTLDRQLLGCNFVVSDDQNVSRAHFIRAFQSFAEFHFLGRQLDRVLLPAQHVREPHRRRISALAHPRDENVHRARRIDFFCLDNRVNEPILAQREADSLDSFRSAEHFDQTVVAPAAAQGILRAQNRTRNLERCPHVVVEPAHQPWRFRERHFAQRQFLFQFFVMRFAIRAEVLRN